MRVNLLQFLFSGACLYRWNDKLRPAELSEIEKQAHKMLVACSIAHENTKRLSAEEKAKFINTLISGALADYFYRLIITDIKPPVFYRIKENPRHFHKLTAYVISQLQPILSPLQAFWDFAQNWYNETGYEEERAILNVSHLFASRWEFNLIRPFNDFDEEMTSIAASFEEGLNKYKYLAGVNELLDEKAPLARFANLCGQLRFQIRWTQIPRIPSTSVLGHTFIVGVCAYLYSQKLGFNLERSSNNFFSGLFHDFPEVLTRDIISPVKRSYEELADLIREYETQELERRVLNPLRNGGMEELAGRLEWYLGLPFKNEFSQGCKVNGQILQFKNFEELNEYDMPGTDARDGKLRKICDLLGAYQEAHNSLRNGISSSALIEGRSRIKAELKKLAPPELNLQALLADFE